MGQDCGSWVPPLQLNSLSPKRNSFVTLSQVGPQDTISAFKNGVTNMASVHGISPAYAQMPHSHVGRENQPHGWFHGLPRFRQAFTPSQKPNLKELFPSSLSESHMEAVTPKAECSQKRFLVFDQSGDQTTLIYSSGIGNPFRCLSSWSPKPPAACDVKGNFLRTKDDLNVDGGMIPSDKTVGNKGLDVESEMHEDTEELNALLYSDDESDVSDDDEVTSSGHSPSTISSYDVQEASVGSTEGVAFFVGRTKKRKVLGVSNNETLSNSMKPSKLFYEDEDDAESSCGSGSVKSFLSTGNKRMKKEKICETVSMLRSIVPDGEGADPIVVLDKAIDYLKYLKQKAKSLGLDAL